MICRHCGSRLSLTLIDLGSAPPSNAYLTDERLHVPEKWYPLRVLVCTECWLAQTEDQVGADELFSNEYAYFSSYSTTWLRHSERYVAAMVKRFDLGAASHVIEVAANDGYLLQYVNARGIPCLGIEPTGSAAQAAREKGIEVIQDFFGARLARELADQGRQADLAVANNVLAHVPDINDFLSGFSLLLKPQGVATFEFPSLQRLVEENQFDTVYHEHFSYLSLTAAVRIFSSKGLQIFDVEEQTTHGGSLRVFAQRSDSGTHALQANVKMLLEREEEAGMGTANYYAGFQLRAEEIRDDLLAFLREAKRTGKRVVAYGAAAKGSTLLNFAGIRSDLISFVADRNPAKQGKFMPGSRIPIVPESRLREERPDYVLILPWNLRNEVMSQLSYLRAWGGTYVTAVPRVEVA